MRSLRKAHIAGLALASVAVAAGCSKTEPSFKTDVMPLIEANCHECHLPGGAGSEKSGLLMDSYENLMKGTKYGPMIVPGSGISSSLYLVIAGKTDLSIRMPHGKPPLSQDEVDTFKQWIDLGAKNN